MHQALQWHSLERSSRMPNKVTGPEEYLDFYSASKAQAEKFVLEQSNENFKTSSLWPRRFGTVLKSTVPKIQMSPEKLQISSNEDCSWR
ncbi:unnamed protein product [Caenorhabditis brenneri]